MSQSGELMNRLKELNEKRKSGELSVREYYRGLMELLIELADALQEEEISDQEIKKQIPLLKVFISEQIKKMAGRGS